MKTTRGFGLTSVAVAVVLLAVSAIFSSNASAQEYQQIHVEVTQ